MLKKTHIAIALLVGLYFITHVNNKIIFLPILLVSTLLPDVDRFFGIHNLSFWKGNSPNTSHHRGILHTYTFCIAVSIALALFYPILALPFFLGYSTHLFADSFTLNGIKPFWPLRFTSSGSITTGGKRETILFWIVVFANVLFFVSLVNLL